KVRYKTTYRIKFYSFLERGSVFTRRYLNLTDLIFESKLLTIERGIKNKIEVDLEGIDIAGFAENIFVCLEVDSYYDENNNPIVPKVHDRTKLKFQQSNLADYYSKTVDMNTKKMSEELT